MHESKSASTASPTATTGSGKGREITRLGDISPQQWKSGIAAWLGWLFDGLDMHLYRHCGIYGCPLL